MLLRFTFVWKTKSASIFCAGKNHRFLPPQKPYLLQKLGARVLHLAIDFISPPKAEAQSFTL